MLRSLDHIELGTAIFTNASGITYASDAFAEIVRRPIAELLGLRMEDITFKDDHRANRWLIQTAVTSRQPFTLRKRYVCPTGELVWVENRYQVLSSRNDEVAVCILSRRLDSLPTAPVAEGMLKSDAGDYIRELSLQLSAMAITSGHEIAADLLALVAKVTGED